ncbi:MAG: Bax inhibitor-1 family protein [Polyangiaceae bacterium]
MRYDQREDRGYGYAPAWGGVAARPDTRDRFIVRTYNHLFGAIMLFAGIEIALFKMGLALPIARAMMGTSWLLVLGAFVLVSWGASHLAHRAESKAAQYAALGGFVVAEAIIFVPLLLLAELRAPGAIQSAGLVTILGFAGLTGIAFWTRKNFSFLGGILKWAGIVALVLIAASLIFGFTLGLFFSIAMVAFAGAAILYDTSRVMHDFPEDRYVAASLELFSSVAMMFWYVLRIFIGSRRS